MQNDLNPEWLTNYSRKILVNNLGVLLELIGLDSVELPDWLLFIVAVIALFITVGSLVFIWKNKKTLINFDSRPFLG